MAAGHPTRHQGAEKHADEYIDNGDNGLVFELKLEAGARGKADFKVLSLWSCCQTVTSRMFKDGND